MAVVTRGIQHGFIPTCQAQAMRHCGRERNTFGSYCCALRTAALTQTRHRLTCLYAYVRRTAERRTGLGEGSNSGAAGNKRHALGDFLRVGAQICAVLFAREPTPDSLQATTREVYTSRRLRWLARSH